MELLSDISSVSTHNSMPPLVDMFGNIVAGGPDDATTITLEPPNTHLYFDEDGNECSYDEYLWRVSHEEGRGGLEWGGEGPVELSEDEEYDDVDTEEEDYEEPPWIRTPQINTRFILKHPRILLAFLRFIDFYNELAEPDEVYIMKAIPQELVRKIRNHSSVADAPPEFQGEVDELLVRLENHMDLSELSWD
jgi:hypothetical protein